LGGEAFAVVQFCDQAFVKRQEFAQPPGVASNEVLSLKVEPFEEHVAHLSKAGLFGNGVDCFERERVPVGDRLDLNEPFANVPGTQPKRWHPRLENQATQRYVGGRAVDLMTISVRQDMPTIGFDFLRPMADARRVDLKRFRNVPMAQKRPHLTDALQAAEDEDQHPFFKTIVGFPDQLKRATQGDVVTG